MVIRSMSAQFYLWFMDTLVVLVGGLPGSGKTWFAKALAGRLGALYISSDETRRTLPDAGDYSRENKRWVYDEMLRRTREAIGKGNDVVIDATFYLEAVRAPFRQLEEEGSKVYLIEVDADEALIRRRLATPRPDSQADFSIYEAVKAEWEPPEDDHLVIWSTNENLAGMLGDAMRYLHLVYDR